MTRDEFLDGVRQLGEVECRPQPSGEILAILAEQEVPGPRKQSRVAFLLPETIAGRPTVFVDATLRTRSGGLPNNWRTQLFQSDLFGTWSFQCPWEPSGDTPATLVIAVLAQWDR
jgi:hypothetical protein